MSCASPMPTENDLAVWPEFAILAALRVSIVLAVQTLRVVHPVDEPTLLPGRDGDTISARNIVRLAERLRRAIVRYERRTAGLHDQP